MCQHSLILYSQTDIFLFVHKSGSKGQILSFWICLCKIMLGWVYQLWTTYKVKWHKLFWLWREFSTFGSGPPQEVVKNKVFFSETRPFFEKSVFSPLKIQKIRFSHCLPKMNTEWSNLHRIRIPWISWLETTLRFVKNYRITPYLYLMKL